MKDSSAVSRAVAVVPALILGLGTPAHAPEGYGTVWVTMYACSIEPCSFRR